MRLVMLSVAYLGIFTSSTASIVGAYGDYFSFVKTVAINNAVQSSTTSPATLKKKAEILIRRQKTAYHGQQGSESTILLLLGLGMCGLAIWGSRRSPSA